MRADTGCLPSATTTDPTGIPAAIVMVESTEVKRWIWKGTFAARMTRLIYLPRWLDFRLLSIQSVQESALIMVSVFLSHSSKDKPFVRELAAFLEGDYQIKVWLDEREIAYGGNIVSGIEEGLDADFTLLILSPNSIDSNWVKEEWTDGFWSRRILEKRKCFRFVRGIIHQ